MKPDALEAIIDRDAESKRLNRRKTQPVLDRRALLGYVARLTAENERLKGARPERACFCCGIEITACMGFTLARDWGLVEQGEKPREFCGRCNEIFSMLLSSLTAERDEARKAIADIAKLSAPPQEKPWQRFADMLAALNTIHAVAKGTSDE